MKFNFKSLQSKYFSQPWLVQWPFQIRKNGVGSFLTRKVITYWAELLQIWAVIISRGRFINNQDTYLKSGSFCEELCCDKVMTEINALNKNIQPLVWIKIMTYYFDFWYPAILFSTISPTAFKETELETLWYIRNC